MFDKRDKILEIVSKDEELTNAQIAAMLGLSEQQVADVIKGFEEEGIIVGRHTMINWDKTSREVVTAFIELKVTPQFGEGFDRIAERVYQYDHVKSVYLMSGTFDIALIIEGKTMKEVALFVAEKLAPMGFVVSTATHFVLKKYKDYGMIFDKTFSDDRQVVL